LNVEVAKTVFLEKSTPRVTYRFALYESRKTFFSIILIKTYSENSEYLGIDRWAISWLIFIVGLRLDTNQLDTNHSQAYSVEKL